MISVFSHFQIKLDSQLNLHHSFHDPFPFFKQMLSLTFDHYHIQGTSISSLNLVPEIQKAEKLKLE